MEIEKINNYKDLIEFLYSDTTLTKEQFAEKLDISRTTLYELFAGKEPADKTSKRIDNYITHKYGLKVEHITGGAIHIIKKQIINTTSFVGTGGSSDRQNVSVGESKKEDRLDYFIDKTIQLERENGELKAEIERLRNEHNQAH